MKKFITLVLFFLYTLSFSQFDTEHWFAPMADRLTNGDTEQYLYLSTNKTTPFKVEIYNNNILYKSVEISKGNPARIDVATDLIITSAQSAMFTPNKMGLHLVADHKFFAHLRIAMQNHAEIITSKGKAGLGNHFFAAMAENESGETYINSTIGIIATENNTSIKLSGYDSNIVFSNGFTGITNPSISITLNKGESYILDVISSDSSVNTTALIGTEIQSDKPISVTNGNFGFLAPNNRNVDVMMDQSQPLDRLGKDYILMKGNGNLTTEMEKALIIATEDNTQVFVNNETTPILLTHKGDYVIIPSNKYILQNATSDVYNMYIRSDKNIYAYQFLGGVDDGNNTFSYASGGMNIIPSLKCLLPNKIDEFAYVDEIGSQTGFDTRLNIITEAGGIVKVNGNPLTAENGPFPVLGNPNWVSYIMRNVSGNIAIESTKAVTAGIAAGNNAVGYGGYFAGFNSNPIISKGSDCEKKDFTLEVDDTYDSYQWYYNGQLYTGSGANTYIIQPTESGYYYVKISKNGCGTQDSPVFTFQRCPFKSTQNYIVADCKPVLTIPAPQFTVSTQTEDYSTLTETTLPINGTISIDKTTGIITYTLTNLSANTDTFTVSLSSNAPNFPDTEFFTYNIDIKHLNAFNGEVFACFDVVKKDAIFNLKNAVITTDTNITNIDYYDAGVLITSDITQYETVAKTIQAVLTNSYACTKTVNIDLKYYPITNINTLAYNSVICDLDFDGLYEVKFSTEVSPNIVSGYTDFNINYFLKDPVLHPLEPALQDDFSFITPTSVYVFVSSKNGCTDYKKGIINFTAGNKISVSNIPIPICDNDLNGSADVKLSDYVPISSNNYYYYDDINNAKEKKSGTEVPISQTISTDKTFYIRVENSADCPNIFELQFIFKQPNTSSSIKDLVICKNSSVMMNAGTGFAYYKWSNGTEGTNLQTATYGAGTHFVELSSNGCVYRQNFIITEAKDPKIDNVIVDGNAITINASGGNPPYEYSIDNVTWQNSNIFTGLSRGLQTVYVRGAEKCTPIESQFLIINLINAITPNNDGINDVLDYSDLKIKKDVKIIIFDRYGSKLFANANQNNYTWNGTNNGRPIPTDTYWYILEWIEPDTNVKMTFKGWILVKNRN